MTNQIHRIFFLIGIFSLSAYCCWAQAEITFEDQTHDFGQVTEGEIAAVEFAFTNTGDQPLVLGEVKASCGCTTPFWTKEPIPPGGQGVVKASYNSKNRPGQFNKSITINSNAKTNRSVLYIKGVVVKNVTVHSEAEKALSPILVIENSRTIQLGKVIKGKPVAVKVTVSNKGKGQMEINGLESACNCVNLPMGETPIIRPGQTSEITLEFTPQQPGNTVTRVAIFSNDITQPKPQLELVATVEAQNDSPVIIKENKARITF